jgi:hypothetical protein
MYEVNSLAPYKMSDGMTTYFSILSMVTSIFNLRLVCANKQPSNNSTASLNIAQASSRVGAKYRGTNQTTLHQYGANFELLRWHFDIKRRFMNEPSERQKARTQRLKEFNVAASAVITAVADIDSIEVNIANSSDPSTEMLQALANAQARLDKATADSKEAIRLFYEI